MNTCPLVFSIVTVVLNDACGFNKTAKSIVRQKAENWEWLVIDGGSSEDTINQISSFSENIAYKVSERDSGIYDAMNKGIRFSNGEYIVFMNAGDTFADDTTLEAINDCIYKDDNIDVVLGGTLQDFNGVMVYRPPKKISWIKKGLPAFHQSTVYRTSFLKERGFNVNCKLLADYEMLAYMSTKGITVAYLDAPVSIYGVGGNSYLQYRNKFNDLLNIKYKVLNMPFLFAYFSSFFRVLNTVIAVFFNRYNRYFYFIPYKTKTNVSSTGFVRKEYYKYKS
jgi:glycosyltransferase involved in cell wall biosynthesis